MGQTHLQGAVGRGELAEVLADERNVLVRASTMEAGDIAGSLLPPGTDPGRANVLAVSYTRSPDEWLDDWRASAGAMPGQCTVVSMGESTRSTAASTDGDGPSIGPLADIDIVGENPEDLTGLGITLGERLGAPGHTMVSFDSLTALLQYVDEELAFRFLHSLTGQVVGANATAHYLLDPNAHDSQTVATLTELFDATIEPVDDGDDWIVRTR